MIWKVVFQHYLSYTLKHIPFFNSTYLGSIYLFEVNNRSNRTTCKICSKLTIKTLNIFYNLLLCFYSWTWTRHKSKMWHSVKILNSLNPLIFFVGRSFLDAWWKPKSTSILDWLFFNAEAVRKSCVHLILVCSFFLMFFNFKILALESVLTPINWNKKQNHSRDCKYKKWQ